MCSGPDSNCFAIHFDQYLMMSDLQKDFDMLALNETNQPRLFFFWFGNSNIEDCSLVAYKKLGYLLDLDVVPFYSCRL